MHFKYKLSQRMIKLISFNEIVIIAVHFFKFQGDRLPAFFIGCRRAFASH